MHRVINLSCGTKWLKMCFFQRTYGSKYSKLYDEGFDKLQNDLNVIKLVGNSKLMMAYQRSQGMNSKRLFKLKHTMENVIDLDSDQNLGLYGSNEGKYNINYQTY